jgi:acetolactate synthase small subunit
MSNQASKEMQQRPSTGVERVEFVILAENHVDVLVRVVVLFHRLNVEIEGLYLVRRSGSLTMRLRVTVRAEREYASRMEAQLYKLVQVRSVETRTEPEDGAN